MSEKELLGQENEELYGPPFDLDDLEMWIRCADVLLLGPLATEGIVSAIKLSGHAYVNKSWASSHQNWHKIADYLMPDHDPSIACVLAKISRSALIMSCQSEDYNAAFKRLVAKLLEKPHLIFVYEGLFDAEPQSFDAFLEQRIWMAKNYGQDAELDEYCRNEYETYAEGTNKMSTQLQWLLNSGLKIQGYATRAALISAAQDFLEEVFRGLTMRVYIPNSRLWSGEMGRLLNLFVEYLQKVDGLTLNLDIAHTGKGVVYELFHGGGPLSETNMGLMLERFSGFLNVCIKEPAKAEELIKTADLSPAVANELVNRYHREAKRISSDAMHDLERKFLSLRHRVQDEILELDAPQQAYPPCSSDVKETIPVPSAATILSGSALIPQVQEMLKTPQIIMNNPQFVQSYKGIVAQEFLGQVEYTEEGQAIRDLIDRFENGYANLELKSSVDALDDKELPANKRQGAFEKIKGFLRRHSSKIEDNVVQMLFKYIEHKMISG